VQQQVDALAGNGMDEIEIPAFFGGPKKARAGAWLRARANALP